MKQTMGKCQRETPQTSCSTRSYSKLSAFAFILKSEYCQGYTTKKNPVWECWGFQFFKNIFNWK